MVDNCCFGNSKSAFVSNWIWNLPRSETPKNPYSLYNADDPSATCRMFAQFEVHQLIDKHGDGKLLSLYLSYEEGEITLDQFEDSLCKLLLPFMYNEGEGQLISPEQWLRYFGKSGASVSTATVNNQDVGTPKFNRSQLGNITQNLNMSTDELNLNSFITVNTHQVCWKLEHRGKYGETPLHICYFLNTPEHQQIAKHALKLFPKLALDRYEGPEYYGENCLHFCITHGNSEAVDTLIDCGANVNSRACGLFFIPRNVLNSPKFVIPDYNGQSYFGEYPLVFAACLEQYIIFDQLYRDDRTNPNFQDGFGNTLAHLMVIHNKPRFLYYALKLPQKPIDLSITNQNGLTPLQLACHLGYYDAFQVLSDARAILRWRFGHLESKTYLIDQLDSLKDDGSINWGSGLHLLCMGTSSGHTDIVNRNPVVDSLLRAKWQNYVKQKFGFNLVLAMIYLFILITGLYLRPSHAGTDVESTTVSGSEETNLYDMLKFGCEVTIIVWSVVSLPLEWGMILLEGSQHVSRGRHQDAKGRWHNQNVSAGLSYLRMIFGFKDKIAANFGSLLLILAGTARVIELQTIEDICLSASIPFLFGNLLFYCRCFSHLGPFITIYYHMVRNTLMKIVVMFLILALGSHCAFHFLFNGELDSFTVATKIGTIKPLDENQAVTEDEIQETLPGASEKENHDQVTHRAHVHEFFGHSNIEYSLNNSSLFEGTFTFLIHSFFGEIDVSLVESSAYPVLARILIVKHGLFVTILLGCLMTAMVCATYQNVMLSFRAENKKEWARIILMLEAQMTRKRRSEKMKEYTENVLHRDPLSNQRKASGLVVTIVRDITDASRRNRAWYNWAKLKYELYKRRFVVHEITSSIGEGFSYGRKGSSDPFQIELLKEKRRRVSINKICRSLRQFSNYEAFDSSGNEIAPMQNSLGTQHDSPDADVGYQKQSVSALQEVPEYSEIPSTPLAFSQDPVEDNTKTFIREESSRSNTPVLNI